MQGGVKDAKGGNGVKRAKGVKGAKEVCTRF